MHIIKGVLGCYAPPTWWFFALSVKLVNQSSLVVNSGKFCTLSAGLIHLHEHRASLAGIKCQASNFYKHFSSKSKSGYVSHSIYSVGTFFSDLHLQEQGTLNEACLSVNFFSFIPPIKSHATTHIFIRKSLYENEAQMCKS